MKAADLIQLKETALGEARAASNAEGVEAVRIKYLGRNGLVQDIMNRDILTVDLRSDHRPTLRLTPNALAELRRAQGIETVENEL